MRKILFALCLAVAFTAPAQAITCIPLVGCSCDVSADDMVFSYAPLSGSAATATSDIDVDCHGLALLPTVIVSLDDGVWGSYAPRRMKGDATARLLNYNLYTTSGHTIVFGNGASSTQRVTLGGGTLLALGHWAKTATVYGLIPANQNNPPDTYRDTITVTITF